MKKTRGDKEGSQRGFTDIVISPDGSFDCTAVNYYSSGMASEEEKAQVTMQFEDVTYQFIKE